MAAEKEYVGGTRFPDANMQAQVSIGEVLAESSRVYENAALVDDLVVKLHRRLEPVLRVKESDQGIGVRGFEKHSALAKQLHSARLYQDITLFHLQDILARLEL